MVDDGMPTLGMPSVGHNNPPVTAEGENLIEKFSKMPPSLSADNAGRAVMLAKQMRLAIDSLEALRKLAGSPHRFAQAVAEKPCKDMVAQLEAARAVVLERIKFYCGMCGATEVVSDHGPAARFTPRTVYEVADVHALPPGYRVVTANDTAIRAALALGVDVPGVKRLPDIKQLIVS